MISKQTAEYQDKPLSKSMKVCAFCSMMVLPDKCSLVEGKIRLRGRCKFWENMLTGKDKPGE